MASSTMSDEALGRLRGDRKKVVAMRPDLRNTTLPTGIAARDPDAVPPAKGKPARGATPVPRAEATSPLDPIAADHESPAALRLLVSVRLADVDLHPDNPRTQYDEGEIASLADDVARNGLIQPIVVRPAPGSTPGSAKRYQLVCGHRRLLACRRLKLSAIAAQVRHLDDVQTLRILASENSHRKDLGPLEEARMLDTLGRPREAGGGGMTDAEAAALYGHSATWATNKKRLLALPEPWRGRLVSREIDETKARLLLPYVDAPRVLAAIDAAWAADRVQRYDNAPLRDLARESFAAAVEELVQEATHAVDDKTELSWRDKPGPKGRYLGWHKCYVDVEAHREQLEIVVLPIRQGQGKKAKLVQQPRITNMAALCRLQAIEIERRAKAKAARADKADGKRKAQAQAEKKTLTPAELRAKHKEAARVLGERIKKWTFALKRFAIAAAVRHDGLDRHVRDVIVDRMLLYWSLGRCDNVADAVDEVLHGQAGKHAGRSRRLSDGDVDWSKIEELREIRGTMASAVSAWLWPTFTDAYQVTEWQVPDHVCDAIGRLVRFDLAKAWKDAQGDCPTGAALLFQKFLALHNSDQLRTLATGWDCHIPDSATKSQAVAILQAKATERTLKLPACLQERGAKARRGVRRER